MVSEDLHLIYAAKTLYSWTIVMFINDEKCLEVMILSMLQWGDFCVCLTRRGEKLEDKRRGRRRSCHHFHYRYHCHLQQQPPPSPKPAATAPAPTPPLPPPPLPPTTIYTYGYHDGRFDKHRDYDYHPCCHVKFISTSSAGGCRQGLVRG